MITSREKIYNINNFIFQKNFRLEGSRHDI